MKKKRNGSTLDLLQTMIGLLVAIVIMTQYLNISKLLAVKEDVKEAARSSLLQMETEGCLTGAGETILRQRLADLGVTDVDLSGTTYTDVGYGKSIYLSIKCSFRTELLAVPDGVLSAVFSGTDIPITVQKMSTAKN